MEEPGLTKLLQSVVGLSTSSLPQSGNTQEIKFRQSTFKLFWSLPVSVCRMELSQGKNFTVLFIVCPQSLDQCLVLKRCQEISVEWIHRWRGLVKRKTYWISEISLLFLLQVFYSSEARFLSAKRQQGLFGGSLWKIQCNNCFLCTNSLQSAAFCKNCMECGHEMYCMN